MKIAWNIWIVGNQGSEEERKKEEEEGRKQKCTNREEKESRSLIWNRRESKVKQNEETAIQEKKERICKKRFVNK